MAPFLLLAMAFGPLRITAEPASLRLGQQASAELRIEGGSFPLQIRCSAGAVEDLREEAPGQWRARYVAPRDRFPHVAVIVAVAGESAGMAALPLWGDGDAIVKTRPRAMVEVQIGPQSFGPMRADATGQASVPVVVPPGVDFAYQGERAIDLHVPRTRTVELLIAGAQELEIDRDREVTLLAAVSARDGSLQASLLPRFGASRGEIADVTAVAPGLFSARWRIPAGTMGTAEATATVDGDPDPARAPLRLLAGAPAAVELRASRERWRAGEGAVEFHATARDSQGNPSSGPVAFETSLGEWSARSDAPGSHRVQVVPPSNFGGAARLVLRARPASGPAAEASVALDAATAAEVSLSAGARSLRADGRSALDVSVRVRDRYGNDVAGAQPEIAASAGRVVAGRGKGGEVVATYVSPLKFERSQAELSARIGEAAARLPVQLDPALHRFSLGAKAGMFADLRGLFAPLAGLEAAWRTEEFGPQLAAVLDATYGRSSLNGAAAAVGYSVREDLWFLKASAAIRRPIGQRGTGWLQGGAVLAAIAARFRGLDAAGGQRQPDVNSSGAQPGFELGAGYEHHFARAVPFVELRWLRTRAFSLAALEGPLSGFSFAAGVRLEVL